MNRVFKLLRLTLLAMAALSVTLGAAGADAASPEFHVTSVVGSGGVVKGASNDNLFSFQGFTIKCVENGGVKGVRYESTLPKTGTSATVKAAYGNAGKGCTAFGVSASVEMKSCDYVWDLIEKSSPATATFGIKCTTAGDAIAFSASSLPCTVSFPAQTGLAHMTFLSSGGAEPTDVTASFTVEKTKYTATGVGCPKAGTFEDGKYTGTVTLEAFESATKVGFHVF